MLGDKSQKGYNEDGEDDDAYVNRIRLSSRLVQCISVVMVMMTLFYVWYGNNTDQHTENTNVIFLHMLSMAAQFGAQCWVTLAAGCSILVFNVRRLCDRLQSVLLPVYFGTTLMLSCITLVTYVLAYDYDSLTQTQSNQFSLLVVCVMCTFINSCFLAPTIVDSMVNVFEMEKSSGVAYSIGYCDKTELKKDPEYCQNYRKCILFGSISCVINTMALVGNVMYMYSLASRATNMEMTLEVVR